MAGSETPDCFSASFDYGSFLASWNLNYNNDYQNGWTIELLGDKGTLVMNGAGYKLYGAPWRRNPEPIKAHEDRLPTIPHVRNFLECVKSREQPNAPVEVGHSAVCGPHLANIAFRCGNQFSNQIAERVNLEQWVTLMGEMSDHLKSHDLTLQSDSIRLSPLLELDTKTEQFVGADAETANRFLKRKYRKGFEVPEIT